MAHVWSGDKQVSTTDQATKTIINSVSSFVEDVKQNFKDRPGIGIGTGIMPGPLTGYGVDPIGFAG